MEPYEATASPILAPISAHFNDVLRLPVNAYPSPNPAAAPISGGMKNASSPLGTYPRVDEAPPLPYEALTDKNFLYDLTYNPEESRFLRQGKEQGAITLNGLPMLIAQAERSWEIWS